MKPNYIQRKTRFEHDHSRDSKEACLIKGTEASAPAGAFIMPRLRMRSEVYGSVFVCVCVSV